MSTPKKGRGDLSVPVGYSVAKKNFILMLSFDPLMTKTLE